MATGVNDPRLSSQEVCPATPPGALLGANESFNCVGFCYQRSRRDKELWGITTLSILSGPVNAKTDAFIRLAPESITTPLLVSMGLLLF